MSGEHQYDCTIVGAGILGLAVARELLVRRPEERIVVLDKESTVAAHQTSHNSGVVHAGIYYEPGSLKAKCCVEGARRLYEFCEEHDVPFERIGKLIVAADESERPGLAELERRGRANGVAGLRMLDGGQLAELEPSARGVAALHSPGTGIVDFGRVAHALAEDVRARGATILTGHEVERIDRRGRELRIRGSAPELGARRAVACCGAWSDRLAVASGGGRDPRIVPFRGAYLKLKPERSSLVRSLIYPVPDPRLPFLGVHLTRTINGDVLVGPTALIAGARDAYRLRRVRARDLASTVAWPGTWKMAWRFRGTAADELRWAISKHSLTREATRYVPELAEDDVIAGPVGVRAQGLSRDGTLVDDFALSRAGGALHVRNAPSPGATSALAIAGMIADQIER